MINKWVPVTERLPDYIDFVWIVSKSCGVELAYHIKAEGGHYWQFAHTAGDSEGLSADYYEDVTHWMDLEYPEYPQADDNLCPICRHKRTLRTGVHDVDDYYKDISELEAEIAVAREKPDWPEVARLETIRQMLDEDED